MADVVKQLDRAINQIKVQEQKHGGKVPALAAMGDSLKMKRAGGKKRHAAKSATPQHVRKAAAKKAARTRKANHLQKVRAGKKGAKVALRNKAKRSAAARRGARTRAGK